MVKGEDKEQLLKRKSEILEKIRKTGNLMRGSLVEQWIRCGRKGCKCEEPAGRHRKVHLTVTLDGKTRTAYVRKGDLERVSQLLNNYERVRGLIGQLTEVNMRLMRVDRKDDGKRGGK